MHETSNPRYHPSTTPSVVRDHPDTAARAYACRIVQAADEWRQYAGRRSPMRPDVVARMAIRSACTSLLYRSRDLVVPMRLGGTSRHQTALWQLAKERVGLGTDLVVEAEELLLRVKHGDEVIGLVPNHHVSWLRPLVSFGARVYLREISGTGTRDYRLQAFVLVGHVGRAVALLQQALAGHGDGSSLDGSPELVLDGPRFEEDEEPIRLWRDEEGNARTNVERVSHRSSTGHEWCYAGAGPAELAHDILAQFVGPDEAWRLHGAFKDDVLERLDWDGAEISRASVRRWIAQHQVGQTA